MFQAIRILLTIASCLCLFLASASIGSAAEKPSSPEAITISEKSLQTITIRAGHSRLIKLSTNVKRASVAKVEIADIVPITERQIYIKGIIPGTTNITLWDEKDRVLNVYELKVIRDLSKIREQLNKIMPQEAIKVDEIDGRVVLWGFVSSFEAKHDAEALVMAMIDIKGKPENIKKDVKEEGVAAPQIDKQFVSLLKVGGNQQIKLKVRFGEVSKKVTDRMNINYGAVNMLTGDYLFGMMNSLISLDEPMWTSGQDPSGKTTHGFSTKLNISKSVNYGVGFKIGDTRILGFLDVLKQNGFAKILAEPTLVTTSGKKAEFLAGGEFPVPVPQRDNISIEYKKFGVQLSFTPEITQDGRIKINVSPEVSEIDYTNAIVLSSYLVPGLTSRKAHGELELADGESFALAGLFRDDITHTVSKLPILGDLPILGVLFRSTEFKQNQTELVIEVTPQIVKGPPSGPVALPTDNVVAPIEAELWLTGAITDNAGGPVSQDLKMKSSPKDMPIPQSIKNIEGGFGHDLGNR